MKIDEIIEYFEEQRGAWNGKDNLGLEEKAWMAGEIIELLTEWQETYE